MDEFVKIRIEDEVGKILKTHYLRVDEWDLPAGKVEVNEDLLEAAIRELVERTGYKINSANLKEMSKEGKFKIFEGKKKDLIQIAKPGEKGGYSTEIKWD